MHVLSCTGGPKWPKSGTTKVNGVDKSLDCGGGGDNACGGDLWLCISTPTGEKEHTIARCQIACDENDDCGAFDIETTSHNKDSNHEDYNSECCLFLPVSAAGVALVCACSGGAPAFAAVLSHAAFTVAPLFPPVHHAPPLPARLSPS